MSRSSMYGGILCRTCRLVMRSSASTRLSQAVYKLAYSTSTVQPQAATTSSPLGASGTDPSAESGYTLPRPYTLPSNPAPPREATHPEKAPGPSKPATKPRPRRPRKAVLTLTPDAVERLKQIQSQDGKLIKISVVAKGCAGGAYRLDYLTPPAGKFDEVVEQDGVTVVVDSRSLMKVIGSVMDFRDDVLASRFVFENPNVVSTCGCEESFATKEDEDRILGTGGKV